MSQVLITGATGLVGVHAASGMNKAHFANNLNLFNFRMSDIRQLSSLLHPPGKLSGIILIVRSGASI